MSSEWEGDLRRYRGRLTINGSTQQTVYSDWYKTDADAIADLTDFFQHDGAYVVDSATVTEEDGKKWLHISVRTRSAAAAQAD